jgi:hypothetical protein
MYSGSHNTMIADSLSNFAEASILAQYMDTTSARMYMVVVLSYRFVRFEIGARQSRGKIPVTKMTRR